MGQRLLCLLFAVVILCQGDAAQGLQMPGKKCEVGCPDEHPPGREWSPPVQFQPAPQPQLTGEQRRAARAFESGIAAMTQRKWSEAARLFDTARGLDPDQREYENQYNVAFALHAWEEALAALNRNAFAAAANLFIEAYDHWPAEATIEENYHWAMAYQFYESALLAENRNDPAAALRFYEEAMIHRPRATNIMDATARMLNRITLGRMINLLPQTIKGCHVVFDAMSRACKDDHKCENQAQLWFRDICLPRARPG